VVLAGISGTGKSELPQRYANFIGAQCLTLAVQPRWDSPQDLQGFYNYIEKKFKPTDLMRGLYQYNHDNQMQNRIVIVLLDEMNLARVEYYFSDFLSKLESRRSGDTYLEIDLGSLPLREEERRLRIPEEFLFVGTMNEDETTQTLSDKVLDRANVLTFGKPENLRLREDSNNSNQVNKSSGYLDYEKFKAWRRRPQVNSPVVRKVKEYLDQANNVMEKIGHPFAHRVYQAITQYVVNYPGVSEVNSAEFRYALADQFGQKLLPKLRGLMIDDYHEELEEMKQLIEQLGDEPLTRAFERSRNSSTGQFEWKGLIYPEE
jgi:5-methylcytosine-specific restriction endonuclease McrBC GTP-binding regulatory subunit McrB